ncbi:MAG: hypothetical protein GXO80_10935 [Chlorobi bacterium]|nr:hypothetical protein [Chlorobiota bacterium]
MKRTILLSTTVIFLLFNIGCKKETTVNDAKAKFTVKQKNAAKTLNKSVNTGSFAFSKVVIGISKIDFEMETGSNDQDYEYEGNYIFDVLTGTSTPLINYVEVTPGTYHELEIKVDRTLSSGNSIEINGTYTEDGTTYTFEYSSILDEDYDVDNLSGVTADPNSDIIFTLYLDLPTLFNGIDFSAATVDDDGVIRINDNSNSNLAETIEDIFDDVMDFDD